ncbi:MAG: hypothetical protein B7Z60_06400 [Ferrovum sp. 37-45-19]|nr:MAG: hypothetical protein B7Z65_04510 [Ferrovum sp. 21-44-67]OYV94075.1 MAG: hypothetical protein B7Z60_06400 [Ferrovum sp. 37-45-19]OZB33964.1 MAG: hypothetical protein B7X47_02345 [Ferrovum sp. 34-44-207]HQT82104.1 glycosyltransferase family 39 protein [Ferrovaceae bacterium]HQU05854.1 glycosyltransferase family 39 protein [Ferrovaceae bacterium]
MLSVSKNQPSYFWILGTLILLSLLPPLWFYIVGEEGVYTIGAMEMWQRQDYLHQTTFGEFYNRPPMIVWAIGLMAQITGFKYIVVAARLVSLFATLGMAALTAVLARTVINDKIFIVLSALITLTLGDLYFYRGWLAYADPLMGFFTMAAVTVMYFAIRKNSWALMILSALSIGAAFLTKSLTPFAIWYSAFIVFSWNTQDKRLHFSPLTSLGLPLPVLMAYFWFSFVSVHHNMGHSMLSDILQKVLATESMLQYLKKIIVFPFSTALNLSPWVPLALIVLFRQRQTIHPLVRQLLLLVLINLIPYWLAPQSHIRYLIGLYPLIGLICAYLLWQSSPVIILWVKRLLLTVVILKWLFGLFLYPYYQEHIRGLNYVQVAQNLLSTAHGLPIYNHDGRSVALNIVNELDRRMYPHHFIELPKEDWQNAFLLSMDPVKQASLYQTLTITGDKIFVYCRGTACQRLSHLKQNY